MTNNDLKVALEAAEAGCDVVKSYKNKDLNIRTKGHHDLVTDADLASEKEILRVIQSHFPDDTILAEESEGETADLKGRLWMVDPIDGTTNFANDFPLYCVSVALWEDGIPVAATVIEVNRHEVFSAARGEGAWLDGSVIKVSGLSEPSSALIGTGFPYKDYSLSDDYIQLFRKLMGDVRGLRRPGSAAYDLCCVAAGRFQGFYEYGLSAWDVAAATLIIQEAGGFVSDWTGGDNWLFGKRIVAGNGAMHKYLLGKIHEEISDHNLTC